MKMIEAKNVKKYFPLKKSILSRNDRYLKALDGISLEIEKGVIHSLVGETGSGKTTFGRIVMALTPPTSGTVKVDGIDLFSLKKNEMKLIRKRIQIIFQDPYSSLNPKLKIRASITEPLKLNHVKFDEKMVTDVVESVGLKPASDYLDRFPGEMSGGQRQRAAIARAFAISPELIIADEPVSMVDVSIRADFLNLLRETNKRENLTVLLITHDLFVASYISDKISVLYLGKIVEEGSKEDIIERPLHPYTQALLDSIPILGMGEREVKIKGEIPNPIDLPSGCRFHPRCPFSEDKCRQIEPEYREIKRGHFVACHLY
jgi:oligopeptide/dipeptide ABC transporter ATP-binding protein